MDNIESLKLEIELLQKKLELLKTIELLEMRLDRPVEYVPYPVYPTYPTYPYNPNYYRWEPPIITCTEPVITWSGTSTKIATNK